MSEHLLTVEGITAGTEKMRALAKAGKLSFFNWHPEILPQVTKRVLDILQKTYRAPGEVPWHSRWLHLEEAPKAQLNIWQDFQRNQIGDEKRWAGLELITLSVLLDAGAGTKWRFTDKESGKTLGRSEGLAAASLSYLARPI